MSIETVSTEWMADFLAGWVSGAAAILACQPVDTLLTRWQAATAPWRLQELYRLAGPAALWRGAAPVLVAAPLQNALLMGGYGMGSRWFEKTEESRSRQLAAIFVGGCTGGVLQSFLTAPVELLKVSQQCSSIAAGPPRLLATTHAIVAHRTMLRGLNATLLRDGLPHGVWFLAYDVTKTTWMQQVYSSQEEEGIPVAVSLGSGAVAATVAWGVGYPADLIKTRIQAAVEPRGILETARTIVQEAEGRVLAGLYRGFGMKLVRSIPASMIGFTVYEGVKERIVGLLNTLQ